MFGDADSRTAMINYRQSLAAQPLAPISPVWLRQPLCFHSLNKHGSGFWRANHLQFVEHLIEKIGAIRAMACSQLNVFGKFFALFLAKALRKAMLPAAYRQHNSVKLLVAKTLGPACPARPITPRGSARGVWPRRASTQPPCAPKRV
jgi:hypothetical protein